MKKKLTPEMNSEQKWIEQFGDEGLNWNKIYRNRLQATKDIRLQNFQYKCLMRIIPQPKRVKLTISVIFVSHPHFSM